MTSHKKQAHKYLSGNLSNCVSFGQENVYNYN